MNEKSENMHRERRCFLMKVCTSLETISHLPFDNDDYHYTLIHKVYFMLQTV